MNKKILGASALLATGLVAGGLFSVGSMANAADSSSTSAVASTSDTTTPPTFGTDGTQPDFDKDGPKGAPMGDPFSATPIRDDEKAVDSDVAAKLTAAAEAKVPGATVVRAETDGDGAAFEVHMKKADGTVTTVKFDANYNITGVEDGFGPGPKGGHGPHHGGDKDGDGPAFQVPSQTPSTSGSNG